MMLTADQIKDIDYELCRKSFKHFLQKFWGVAVPGSTYTHGLHLDAIIEHLEAVSRGEIKRLIVNIQPRLGKTTLISILYPLWYWIQSPHAHILTGSFSTEATHQPAYQARLLLECPLYKEISKGLTIAKDQASKTHYMNSSGGSRIARSLSAGVQGLTANLMILDDPLSSVQAESNLERDRIVTNFISGWLTRLTPAATAPCILVSQRLHEDDLAGVLMRDSQWETLILEAEFSGKQRSRTSLGWKDPRKKGDLLFPEMVTPETYSNFKAQGNYFWASQFQQSPIAEEGNLFQIESLHRHIVLPETIKRVVLSADTAIKTGTRNDYSVLIALGEGLDGRYYLMDMVRKKAEFKDLFDLMIKFYEKHSVGRSPTFIIEDKASGSSLLQELKRQTALPLKPIMPGRDFPPSKNERASMLSLYANTGKLSIPYRHDDFSVKDIIHELQGFPYASHDDIVDALGYAVLYLAKNKGGARIRIL